MGKMMKYLALALIATLTIATTAIAEDSLKQKLKSISNDIVTNGVTLANCNEGVIITFEDIVPTICPGPPPVILKHSDGTYYRGYSSRSYGTDDICYKTIQQKELWSDYPEKGGKFIREVE